MRLFEARKIYKNAKGSHFLVLNTTRTGMMFVYIDVASAYNDFPELAVSDIGYIAFDRILYVPWHKLNMSRCELYKTMSNREYSKVVDCVTKLMKGEIIYHEHKFVYSDEVSETIADCVDDNHSEVYEPVTEHETCVIPEALTETTKVNDDSDNANDIEVKPIAEDTTSEEASNNDLDESGNIEQIYDSGNSNVVEFESDPVPDADIEAMVVNEGNIKMYDLTIDLWDKSSEPDCESKYPAKRATAKKKSYSNRRLFTEDDVLSISMMAISAIRVTYKVSPTMASRMRKNARLIVGIGYTPVKKVNNLVEMFDKKMDLEEIARIANRDISWIKSNYNRYLIRGIGVNDPDTVLEKYNVLYDKKDYAPIVNALSMTIIDFAKAEGITYTQARDVMFKIRSKLSINPFYSCGFGVESFDYGALCAKVDGMRNSSKKADITYVSLFDKIDSLVEAFYASFGKHHDIISGMASVKEYTDSNNTVYLYSMIWNRFNTKTINKVRVCTKEQREAIDRRDAYAVSMLFMCQYDKARNIIATKY